MQCTGVLQDLIIAGEQVAGQGRSGSIQTTKTGSSPCKNMLPILMKESVLYYRRNNVLIKFDGLYWSWSPEQKNWNLNQNLATEHFHTRDFIHIPEEEALRYRLSV
jgi:hypothetical protein